MRGAIDVLSSDPYAAWKVGKDEAGIWLSVNVNGGGRSDHGEGGDGCAEGGPH